MHVYTCCVCMRICALYCLRVHMRLYLSVVCACTHACVCFVCAFTYACVCAVCASTPARMRLYLGCDWVFLLLVLYVRVTCVWCVMYVITHTCVCQGYMTLCTCPPPCMYARCIPLYGGGATIKQLIYQHSRMRVPVVHEPFQCSNTVK